MGYVIYLVTGVLAGVVGGLLGTGGCALMMPVIRFGFHFDPRVAVGTTLTAVVFTAASGAYQHIKMGNVDRQTAMLVGYAGVLGVIIGSVVFAYLCRYGELIDLIIGVAFIVVSVRMVYEGVRGGAGQPAAAERVMGGAAIEKNVLGSIVGFLTGIIGLGGGYALVPSFVYFLRAPMKLAIGTSMASFVWLALVGSTFKLYQGVVDIPVAIALGVGAVIGAIYGARLVRRFRPNTLKLLFGILFLYVSLKYILIYFGVHI